MLELMFLYFFSGIYRYPAFAAGGWFLGGVVYTWHHKRVVEHEMAIWDYVERHPEDFPELSKEFSWDMVY